MVMIKPKKPMPEHVVSFKVDPRMTDWDVKNYLERIYKVPVGAVNSMILAGDLIKTRQGLAKRDDYRIVHVSLQQGYTFKWPEIFTPEQEAEQEKDMKRTLKALEEGRQLDPNTRLPGWISKITKQTR